MLPLHEQKENGKRKKIITAALISTGAVLVLCALGILGVNRRLDKHNNKSAGIASLCDDQGGITERSKSAIPQSLVSKVRDDPGFALLVEPQGCVKGTCDNVNITSAENVSCALDERKDPGHETTKCGTRERNSSSAEEIISVHEYAESCKCESDGQNSPSGENLGSNDPHFSEDESFHSFINSRSPSNLRLSNVSLGSFSDPVEVFSPDQLNRSPISQETAPAMRTASCNSLSLDPSPPPLPPPPPPPPPPCSSPPHSVFSAQTTNKASQSPSILQSSFPRNPGLPLGLNQTQGNDVPSSSNSPKTPSKIPPPPCPPPFLNGNGKSFKGPPPPPAQLSPSTPLGKDGAPLPKLKPLHWDKVRAAPDRSMVWDQLRCSSFE